MDFFETEDEQRINLNDGTYIQLLHRNVSILEFGLTPEESSLYERTFLKTGVNLWDKNPNRRNEYARNVYRMTEDNDEIWRINIKDEYKITCFTQLFVDENPRLMYCSSGFRCIVDLDTGIAEIYDYPLLGPWKKRPFPVGYPETRYLKKHNEQRVYLDDGTYLFLAERNIDDTLTGLSPEDYARNVFRMTESGEILWTIKTDRDSFGSPFIELFLDEDSRKMANWDGLKYLVDLETGETESYAYSR